ncbi:MAG: C69 family dipeptidase [Bacteroidetes bacterium]|nr:C69 family dipeptidase [Bacteroidota bacterium]
MKIHLLTSLLIILLTSSSIAQEHFDCFSILVGKGATADGSVMLAHNEDDWGDRIVNWYKVPSLQNKAGETVTLKNGALMEKPNRAWSYLWLEMPEMEFSDSYMNEWGVTIASDACMSREDQPELTDGGIGYWLRRAMAEQAKTAREAVKIGGALVQKYGYTSSGRTYCIADGKEVWMLSVVKGKHWIAQRVPFDHVAIIPNYYTISRINMGDTMNFQGSADIVEYAIKRGWYDPKNDGVFSFREVYSDPGNLSNMGNLVRHMSAINALSDRQYYVDDEFPFSFVPRKQVDLKMLFDVLRNHNEGTPFDEWKGDSLSNPHQHGRAICSATTQYGFVAQLRNNLPREIGFVLWISPFRPCVHPFTQWYFGMDEMPDYFAEDTYREALGHHWEAIDNVFEYAPRNNFLKFVKHAKKVDEHYAARITAIQKRIHDYENELINKQETFERSMVTFLRNNQKMAGKSISDYCAKQVEKSLEMIP